MEGDYWNPGHLILTNGVKIMEINKQQMSVIADTTNTTTFHIYAWRNKIVSFAQSRVTKRIYFLVKNKHCLLRVNREGSTTVEKVGGRCNDEDPFGYPRGIIQHKNSKEGWEFIILRTPSNSAEVTLSLVNDDKTWPQQIEPSVQTLKKFTKIYQHLDVSNNVMAIGNNFIGSLNNELTTLKVQVSSSFLQDPWLMVEEMLSPQAIQVFLPQVYMMADIKRLYLMDVREGRKKATIICDTQQSESICENFTPVTAFAKIGKTLYVAGNGRIGKILGGYYVIS